jgi:hypothetical protein
MVTSPSAFRWLPFIGGFALGAVVAVLAVRQFQPRPQPAVGAETPARRSDSAPTPAAEPEALTRARERVTKLEADNLKLAERVQALSKATTANPPVKAPETKSGGVNPLAALFGGEDGGTNEAGKAMRGVMAAAMKQQLEGKLRQMKTKLNLSPEQEQSIRGILEQQFGAGQAMAEKMFSGKATADDVTAATQAPVNPIDQIKALLSPEQQTAYDEVQTEEKRNHSRLIANSELLQMQGALGLTQEQQDSVFKALYAATEEQFGGLTADPAKVMDFRGNLDRKLNALKGVLTDEQFKAYEDMQQQQLKLIEAMLPQGGNTGDAVLPKVQLLPP